MWLGILLAWAFCIVLRVFSIAGGFSFDLRPHLSFIFIWSLFQRWFLPFVSLFLVQFGGWAIGMRNLIIYKLEADYLYPIKLIPKDHHNLSFLVCSMTMLKSYRRMSAIFLPLTLVSCTEEMR